MRRVLSILLALIFAVSIVTTAAAEDDLQEETVDLQPVSEAADMAESGNLPEQVQPLAAPVLVSAKPAFGGMSVKWQAVEGAVEYYVYRKGADWEFLAAVSDTSYLDETVVSGVRYTYTVRCSDTGEMVNLSDCDEKGVSGTYVAAPMITSIKAVKNGVQFTWDPVNGVAKYRTFYKNGSKWKKLGDTASTVFTHADVKNDTEYIYTVRALDSKGDFCSSVCEQGWSFTRYGSPALKSVTSEVDGLKISWKKVTGAPAYRVYLKDGSSWKGIGNSTGASYVYKKAVSGKKYTFTVRCYDTERKTPTGWYDTKGISATFVAAPTITSIHVDKGGIKLTWTKSKGAAKYRAFVKNGKKWKGIGTTSSNSLLYKDFSDGNTYTYTVRALDKNGAFVSGFNADGWSEVYYQPAQIVYDADSNTIVWEPKDGCTYRVYSKTFGSGWTKIADIDVPSYPVPAASDDLITSFSVRYMHKGFHLSYHSSLAPYFKNGQPFTDTGFKKDGTKRYYFKKGVMVKNDVVGSKKTGYYYVDETGVCCESKEMRLAAEFIMNDCKGADLQEKMKYGFLYMAKRFPYRRTYDHPKSAKDLPGLAIDMFTNRSGNCFRYAACFACVAKCAGYRTRVALGAVMPWGNPHGWTEVLVDGQWLICDPDAQIPSYGVADYKPYMMKRHYWKISANTKCELTIKDGKAVWK